MPRQLKNLRIDDVSSVDRGAGEGVRVVLLKREFSQEQRDAAASRGQAMPDGSFPIKNTSDLKNAIQAIGRAKNPAAAKAHIKTRARALGATDMLPDDWTKRDEAAAKALRKAIGSIVDESTDFDAATDALTKTFQEFHEHLNQEEDPMPLTIEKDELSKLIGEIVGKALSDAGVLNKMTPAHAAYHQNLDGDEAKRFSAMGHDDREKYVKEHPISGGDGDGGKDDGDSDHDADDVGKALALIEKMGGKVSGLPKPEKQIEKKVDEPMNKQAEEVAKLQKRNDELSKQVAALVDQDEAAKFAKRAVDLGLPEADGDKLRKAHKGDPESLKWLEDTVKRQNVALKKSDVFKEFGHTGAGETLTAYDELVAKAVELRKAENGKITQDQAFARVIGDPANAELAKREREQRMARINGRAA